MSGNTTSATLGRPPNTLDDYYTIRALLRDFGLDKLDPNDGYVLVGPRPPGLPFENKQAGIIVGMVIMMLIIILPTGARLRLRATKQQMVWGPDDWAILLAAVVCFLYPIFQIVMVVDGGGGTHIWDVTYTQYRTFMVFGQASRTVYYVVVGLVKLSITFFFRRLADKASKVWRVVCDFFLATCCINKEYIAKILGIMHVAQGALMLTVPIAILWTVRIDRGKKARLFLNWFVGAVAVVGGMVKTWYFVFSPDMMWTYAENVLLFTSLDLCLGIVTASVPVLDHLLVSSFGFMANKLVSSSSVIRNQGSGTGGVQGSRRPTLKSDQTTRSAGSSALPYSESSENIIKNPNNLELKIMRTMDVNVTYERRNDSISDDCYDEEGVTKTKGV
ncbi:uncharacterized protein B0I36DRAFT_357028 [Microdochium trichocladiopsis]|uniref:Rhodopsin domain-containing protein n=1 Tax=Microdochium trichocladiopsis TaxID=1682393 RepID=A0A9P8YIH2_9PEZI|nr:uncharacterized protein B0I36DRAFT_357028 [Microdochium trichocladiopsis]KAH7039625.1 hypothetical protein B0I36DRAFT_357028 [Microdochium trichocladiopsis]